MKSCRCKKCKTNIDLSIKSCIRIKVIPHGYKDEYEYIYYAECPNCNKRQPITYKEIPFVTKIKLFLENFI